ncbi:MAG: hypothetical protein H6983_23900 [Ectothiorhodospiraceae bacterium]|nr:hypothetical protein [Chromatiales bacterium]MCP5157242.1 hypothetical protein [Ectothiorhodospiraceae bacterium]
MSVLKAESLLAGASVTHDLAIPPELLGSAGDAPDAGTVRLRPLTLASVQRILKAAKDDDGLMSALIVREALVEPRLTYEQAASLPSGLARFLLREARRISGLDTGEDELAEAIQAPLARACFVLAREFGWTPQQVSELTVGQVLLYLEMTRQENRGEQTAC